MCLFFFSLVLTIGSSSPFPNPSPLGTTNRFCRCCVAAHVHNHKCKQLIYIYIMYTSNYTDYKKNKYHEVSYINIIYINLSYLKPASAYVRHLWAPTIPVVFFDTQRPMANGIGILTNRSQWTWLQNVTDQIDLYHIYIYSY